MASLWQIFGEWSPWMVAIPSTVIGAAWILRVLAYWLIEEHRLAIVRSLVSAETPGNPALRANLDKLIPPTPPPAGMPSIGLGLANRRRQVAKREDC